MLKLTENAIERLQAIAKDHNRKYCRLAVKGGGCAGFEYEWTTTDNEERGDVLLKDILVVNRDYELFLLVLELHYILYLIFLTFLASFDSVNCGL